MRILKICIIAASIGMFATSCRNRQCADTNAATPMATTPSAVIPANDGTQAAANMQADTMDINNQKNERESVASKPAKKTPGKVYVPVKKSTTAQGNGPDLEASKRREGNFTHGTGYENPGR